jgi:ubiquitin-conjugating enzyme E2 N
MGAPNPDDPLANDVAQHWKSDEKAAIETGKPFCNFLSYVAREWTKKHAVKPN